MSSTSPGPVALAYVVPTMNRPEDLGKLLRSLERQTRKPEQIIVVDGSDEDKTVDGLVAQFDSLPLEYVRVFPPSLARQRNAGMAKLRDDIEVAGYLDDDLILDDDATERMAAFWEAAAPDTGGAAFNITNQPGTRGGFTAKVSGLRLFPDDSGP